MKKYFIPLLILSVILILANCTREDTLVDQLGPLNSQVRVQVAYDDSDVAFKFTWKTQKKLFPAGQVNVGLNYPMQFHDMLKHNGSKFDRLPGGERMEEDRITLMINKIEGGIPGFATAGCAVSCHTGMESHNLETNDILDHWHWRGARSGPMGYAEDAAVNNKERIRDEIGVPPSKFLRSGGDRLRENQVALSGSGHPVLEDGLPRFVFNKGKIMGNGFTVGSYFLSDINNKVLTNPYQEIPLIRELTNNRSLLVIYQDKEFDKTDKVNSLDLGYLVWLATNTTEHLPVHLRDESSVAFNEWKNYCASESNISSSNMAIVKLNEVHAEWTASNRQAMITRSVGFIYPSDQHDVRSERYYDEQRNLWTVILKRKLSTGSINDEDLMGIISGKKYTFSFAMHDSGSGAITHDLSMPMTLSNSSETDLKAAKVSDVNKADWKILPANDTYWVKQEHVKYFYYDWLKSPAHPGASVLTTTSCGSCHSGEKSLLTNRVIN